jgi:cytochrome c-type biogenesis protein CcmF
MVSNVGFGILAITFAVSLYGIIAAITGAVRNSLAWVESARLAQLFTFPLLTISTICLAILLVNGDYQVAYVYSTSSNTMPMYLKITALWGGQAGSLLFWSWLLAGFAAAVTLRKWDRDRALLPWVIVVSLVTLVFFLFLTIVIENPFARYWFGPTGTEIISLFKPAGGQPIIPQDGRGLNPLLRHPGMIIHPPALYLGFVSFVVPYAFAMAALITGRTDDRWIRITRRWTLVAWLFLSLGLLLGSRWAYDVLGWGGYWGWDPVEIAAFMPWLTGTAFLHSVMIQERRGLFKRWNMILIILTYSLIILGTFLTRSGVLSSVHAFAQSAIGPLFFGFIGVTFIISLYFLLQHWDDLRGEGRMDSLFSREALFLYNNLLFMGILAVCFWGVIYPIVSELFTGQKVTVGPPFYERAAGPLFAGLLLLMGLAPLSAWGRSALNRVGRSIWKPFAASLLVLAAVVATGYYKMSVPSAYWVGLLGLWLSAFTLFVTLYEYGRGVFARQRSTGENLPLAFWNLASRNRRRYGGYIIHIGVVLMALGIIGIEVFQDQTQGTISQGETIVLRDYTIEFESLAVFDAPDGRNVARAVVSVWQDGKIVDELYPRRDYFYDAQQPMTIPGLRSTIADDLYIILVDWQPISSGGATFKVFHNPLVKWLWVGGYVFILGMLVAAWPDKEKEGRT